MQDGADRLSTVRLSTLPPDERQHLLEAYERDVYAPAFPDAELREDPAVWLRLLGSDPYPPPPQPRIEVVLLRDGGRVVGGATVEHYREADCGLLTYISVAPAMRGRSAGKTLVREAHAALEAMAGPDRLLFAETERLEDAHDAHEREETVTRQRRLHALGARLIDFDYVMPPLRDDVPPRQLHLMVLADDREVSWVPSESVRKLVEELAAALGADIEAHEDTRAMMASFAQPRPLSILALPCAKDIRSLREVPYFAGFEAASVSFAFELKTQAEPAALRLRWVHDQLRSQQCYKALVEPLRSFFDDVTTGGPGTNGRPLLFRAAEPPPEDPSRRVWLHRRPTWRFDYEGDITLLQTSEASRDVMLCLQDSFCVFESGRIFYLLTLTLPEEAEGSLDEYALLQLQQMGLDKTKAANPRYLAFATDGAPEERLSLRQLMARRLSQLGQDRDINGVADVIRRYDLLTPNKAVGWDEETLASADAPVSSGSVSATLEGMCLAVADPGLLAVAKFTDAMFDKGERAMNAPEEKVETRALREGLETAWEQRCAAACSDRLADHCDEVDDITRGSLVIAGLAQGVPDFTRQDESEVHDASRPAERSVESILFVHPHFVLSIGTNWGSYDRGREALGTCPYLLMMWTVALHDELIVKDIEERLEEAMLGTEAKARVEPLAEVKNVVRRARWLFRDRTEILDRNLDQRLEMFRRSLIHRSGNIFRYPREREALAAIQRELGTGARFDAARQLTEQLEGLVEDVTALKSSYAERRTNRILFIIAIFSVFSVSHDLGDHLIGDRLDPLYIGTVAVLLLALVVVLLWERYFGPSD